MESLIVFLCVLSALTATGFSLTCRERYTHHTTDDFVVINAQPFREIVKCPPNHACGTTYTDDGDDFQSLFTTCVPVNHCNMMGSLSTINKKGKKSVSCCYRNNCDPPNPTIFGNNNQTNGVNCTACNGGASSTWCNSEDTMQCNGNETRCLLMIRFFAERGCATESICSFGTELMSDGSTTKYFCTSASGDFSATIRRSFDLHISLFFSSIVALAPVIIVYF